MDNKALKQLLRTWLSPFCVALSLFTLTPSFATPIVEFEITGNTFYKPFKIKNLSTNNELIDWFSLDFVGTRYSFDTQDNISGSGLSKPFSPLQGTGLNTGAYQSETTSDDAKYLQVFFTDFNANEVFLWNIDVDVDGRESSPVNGHHLIGSLFTVSFSDGLELSGLLEGIQGEERTAYLSLQGTEFHTIPEPRMIGMFVMGLLLIFGLKGSNASLSNLPNHKKF